MKKIDKQTIIIAFTTLLVGFVVGGLIFGGGSAAPKDETEHSEVAHSEWTCSMHPQIRQAEPGQCPICGMDLIPIDTDQVLNADPLSIQMSPTAMQLASVQTAKVVLQQPVKQLRLTGKVQPNEQHVSSQVSHITGRIEKLKVNFTGEYIKRGQIIAYIYSPELLTAQKELFEAQKIKATQPALFQAAREKLKNWKLTDRQIDGILASGKPVDNFPILADQNGVVIAKKINVGDHVSQGQALYEIADLSQLWVLFDVYERNMAWVKTGDQLSFTIPSLPGETFTGTVSFIDPIIDSKSRVAKARVIVNNNTGRLKPEMFATGILESPIGQGEVSVVVPKSAVMWTGQRSVVYVKIGQGNFMMREVVLGPSLGDSYVVSSGLSEGEEIVVYGTFSVDAAAQLAGKPSMMNKAGGTTMTGHQHENMNMSQEETADSRQEITVGANAKAALRPLLADYMQIKNALTRDNYSQAQKAAEQMKKDLSEVDMTAFEESSHQLWMQIQPKLSASINALSKSMDIQSFRQAFIGFSENMIKVSMTFNPTDTKLYIQKCPMANRNQGARWMSIEEEINNPYFGSEMPKCGKVTHRFGHSH
ncbi:efflux RND transporter periplasmic adaptor subunit [Reichenbachiella agariperforans]|uniref:efflux RND transporter periplasmic adaptor subunit n=1 Tax=Reichenbachiella agariperforans TaxID=156994 RepID=UPI001C09FF9F|nr:efflux RND transporter periplasmic adaptor subunit [Reichenbachiella agariperforans]MBU2915011.1 efflux RND transporter periplasmic adaptor subunit [Reichenbachiella agariperforans]